MKVGGVGDIVVYPVYLAQRDVTPGFHYYATNARNAVQRKRKRKRTQVGPLNPARDVT